MKENNNKELEKRIKEVIANDTINACRVLTNNVSLKTILNM